MENFIKITKKHFCETLCNQSSIFVSSGIANESFLTDKLTEIIAACNNIDANNDNTRTGKLKSNCIEFINQQNEISRLYFDQIDTNYTFYNLSNIYLCRIHYKSADYYRYIIYKAVGI